MSVDAIVINLTRLGDLLQSQGVIDDLHKAGRKAGLVCIENFAPALPLLRHVEGAWPLPGAKWLRQLDGDWRAAAAELSEFARLEGASEGPRAILNLTPTLPARLLARLIARPGDSVFGFGMDEFGYGENHGVWASFFSAAAAQRGSSPFNLADLMRLMALPITGGRRGDSRLANPPGDALAWAREFLAANRAAAADIAGHVAFQLGASQDSRRWPVAHFRGLGDILWREARLVPILLGSPAERHLADEYKAGAEHPFIDACGQTDIPRLAALVAHAKLVATNDTGTMHLAAGLGAPVLAFFLATAQPWDTGPLLEGACSLEPALACHPCGFGAACAQGAQCRARISPRAAADYVLAKIRHGDFSKAPDSGEARAWITRIDDLVDLEPASAACANERSNWLAWQRAFWLRLLGGFAQEPDAAAYGNLPALAQGAEIASQLLQAARLLDAASECGAGAGTSPALGRILLRNCERLQSQLDAFAPLAGFGAFWREFRLNQAADLPLFCEQARSMAAHFRALAEAMA